MARPSKSNKRKQAQTARAATAEPQPMTRRNLMGWIAGGAAGITALGAGGAWAVSSFNRSVEERDLTRIGQGVPSVVQIHDPQCPICNALQREARKALRQLDGEPPIYLIADLTQTEGAIFAQTQSVQHVTLLIFDAEGNRVETLTGSRTDDELVQVFANYTR